MREFIRNKLKGTWVADFYRTLKLRQHNNILLKEFKDDLSAFRRSGDKSEQIRFEDKEIEELPHLNDKTTLTPFDPHYIYHPAWAARVLAQTKPEKHIDISSTLNFSAIVSAFLPVEFYDYRPAKLNLEGLSSHKGDLTALPFPTNSVASLSCMHTIEHIGLGRYGDPIDYDGDLKAISELKRVLSVEGDLLIVTPVGKAKIEFNAHRIYSFRQIVEYFSPLELIEFSLVPDNYEETGLVNHANEALANAQGWGCGCFWFKKKS